MMRFTLPLVLLLGGCTSMHLPGVRSDFYETQYRGAQALDARKEAFDRLGVLQTKWVARGEQGVAYTLMPWDRRNRDRSAQLADATLRVTEARDAILAQNDLVEVMGNALKDLEAEYDAIAALYSESEDAPVAKITLAAEQKYLARRMANSLVLMSQSDMTRAVEAADIFGRDVARFQLLLDASINGHEEMGIDPPDNPEVEESLAQIEDLFTGYVADSATDVLENVVARYDAWSALQSMTALGNQVLLGQKPEEPGDEEAPEAAEDADEEDAGGDAPAGENAGDMSPADDAEESEAAGDSEEGADTGSMGDDAGDGSAEDAGEDAGEDDE